MHRSYSITSSACARPSALDRDARYVPAVPAAAREGLRQPQGLHEKNSEPAEKHAPASAERRRAFCHAP
jgi:hypothetical protein